VEHCTYILTGGLFYLFISLLFYFLRPHRYMELQIADCLRLTSKYLKLRGDLWNIDADRIKITEQQLEIQVEINAIHENIREFLFRNTINSINSNENRKMLIVFTNLVEILEIALSFSFNHNELHQRFDNHPKTLRTYQHLAYTIAATLKKLSQSLEGKTKYASDHSLFYDLEKLQHIIEKYQTEINTLQVAPGDMERLGLAKGDRVRLTSERGQVVEVAVTPAKKDELPEGLLFIAYGDISSRLMGGDTHGSGMPTSKGFDVSLEKIA